MRIGDGSIMHIDDSPVMESALEVLMILNKTRVAVLRASGDLIPNAVAVANIITENMLQGHSKVQRITLDANAGIGKMTSTIEIVVEKT